MTTREPGASEHFTFGFTFSPFSTAFFATRPAATITEGFEVLVQEVMAAITTEPCWSERPVAPTGAEAARSAAALPKPFLSLGAVKSALKVSLIFGRSMRSCGRFGPETQGTTVPMSRSMVWV